MYIKYKNYFIFYIDFEIKKKNVFLKVEGFLYCWFFENDFFFDVDS